MWRCCFGGWPSAAFDFWVENGIPSGGEYGDNTTCIPYFEPPGESKEIPPCETECQEGYPIPLEEDKSYGGDIYSVYGEDDIMKEIYENGSVAAAFDVYEDFEDYKGGIYQHVTGDYLGGHTVKIIGWGVDEQNVKYWIIANSWGKNWGEQGFFRMLRGEDECGIEDEVVTGIPKL